MRLGTRRKRERTARALQRLGAVTLVAGVLGAGMVSPASAQMNFFGFGEASTQDVYATIADHGFRLIGPLMRNGDVYVADVIDRRQRRERLIISRSDAQIVQRFVVDLNGQARGGGTPVPQRAPVARTNDSDFFSRLTRGWGDDAPPRPPAAIDNGDGDAVMPPTLPRQQRIVRTRPPDTEPRLTTRREDAPITSRPLPPVTNPPVPNDKPAASPPSGPIASVPAPSTAAFPAAPTPAPSSPPVTAGPTRATVVSTDPLRIPGEREAESPKAATGTATLAKQTSTIKPAVPKPAATPDVPVAPLD